MTNPPLIEVRSLEKQFGHTRALRGVDLAVSEGEFLTVFGPNGAGKTTLIKTIATIVHPTRGDVSIKGERLTHDSIGVRRLIGLVSHNPLLYDDLTAAENLRFFGRMYGTDHLEGRIEQLLRDVGLAARRHDRVRGFSRGMVQRLAIARAVLHDPLILLLDEPYTGLDVQATAVLDELLEQLKTSGHTFIMTSHDIAKGFEHADRVCVLASGAIVFIDEKKNLDVEQFSKIFWEWVEEPSFT